MLQQLPVIDQDKDDIKFTEQYVKATDLFIRSLENSSLGRISKFRAIYQMTRHQQDVVKKLGKAQLGDTRELEGILDKLRSNFQSIMDEFFKLNPSLIEPTFKEIKKKKDLLPDHGQDTPVRAEHYFRMLKDDRNPDKKKDDEEKVTLVRVVNKTSIPVRLIGGSSTGNQTESDVKEERSLRKRFFSFLSFSERGRSSRSIFRGGNSRVATGVASLISGHGLVNLPNIIGAMLVNMFGKLISNVLGIVMAGVGLLGKTLVGRLVTLGVGLLTGVVEKGIIKLAEWLFGEDSGITKVVKDFFGSDYWSKMAGGGALGAGLGSLFGPAGMFWGFIIGSVAGLLKAWIDDDGPKKLLEGMSKLWDAFKTGIDNFIDAVTKPISNFFKSVENYIKDKMKLLGFGLTDDEKKNNIIKENEKNKSDYNQAIENSQNMNLPLWKRDVWENKANNLKGSIKSDEQISSELNAIDKARTEELNTNEKVLAKLREKLAKEKRPFEREALQKDIALFESKVSAIKGIVKPAETPITMSLYNDMIGQKKLESMPNIMPTIVGGSTTVSSTNISNKTTNSMMMQLSPISNDRIN